jgi:EpsI family protein
MNRFAAVTWSRFLVVLALIAATAVILQAHERPETIPPHQNLDSFPVNLDGWSGTTIPLTDAELAVLGPGEFLVRDYQRSATEPPVNLYIAYFPSQRTGDTIHSPKNCLPGAGWVPDESSHMTITAPDGSPMTVNRYIVSKGDSRALVLYWYQAHGRVTAGEYWAKIFLVSDAIRLNRTDGALVRVVTSIANGTDEAAANTRALEFTQQVLPRLDAYIPR